jgi:hypothetical protein
MVFICKPDYRFWFIAKLKTLEMLFYTRWVLLCLGKPEAASPKEVHRRFSIRTPSGWSPRKDIMNIFWSNLSRR